MPASRFIWLLPLWASSCVLARSGSLETAGSGAGGSTPQCDADEDCAGTTCRPSRCADARCSDEVAPAGTTCSDDGGAICNGMGSCVRENATPCGSGAECLSGFCADGVCCDAGCTSDCESCLIIG